MIFIIREWKTTGERIRGGGGGWNKKRQQRGGHKRERGRGRGRGRDNQKMGEAETGWGRGAKRRRGGTRENHRSQEQIQESLQPYTAVNYLNTDWEQIMTSYVKFWIEVKKWTKPKRRGGEGVKRTNKESKRREG